MRAIVIGLLALLAAAPGLTAQQHGHGGASRDTTMRAMPGMKKPASAGRDSSKVGGKRTPADTVRRGMRGMRMPADTARRGMRGMRGMRMGRDTTMAMGGRQQSMAMSMPMSMTGPLGIPESRDGSGTAWQPEATPMYALERSAGAWSLMAHGNAFLEYVGAGSRRGEQQLGSVNWFMGMAQRALAGGELALRGMVSLEPITVGKCGYPDLLATGESCNGRALHDRQHPHDVFMEVAALYERALTRSVAFELYGGPAGEPALGPVAYPHRVSALWSPLAPISHHWQDATHISFGVVTAGVYGRRWKLEGSKFNGREPDDNRFDFDLAALDSYSGRVWLAPSDRLVLQLSSGHLRDAEGPGGDVQRTTASLAYTVPFGRSGLLASTLVWGRNGAHGLATDAWLAEGSLELDGRNIVYGRGELDQKTGEDLALGAPLLAGSVFSLGKLSLGYTRQLGRAGAALRPAIGGELSLSMLPQRLQPFYGTTSPLGFALYLSVRPGAMRMGDMHAQMPGAGSSRGRAGGMMMAPRDTAH